MKTPAGLGCSKPGCFAVNLVITSFEYTFPRTSKAALQYVEIVFLHIFETSSPMVVIQPPAWSENLLIYIDSPYGCQRADNFVRVTPAWTCGLSGVAAFRRFLFVCLASSRAAGIFTPGDMVGLTGLEPVTPRLSSVCSNQLSYRPMAGLQPAISNFKFEISNCAEGALVEACGFEPQTFCLQSRRSTN